MSLCYSPVVIEVPNFAALRGNEREIVILRSDNGETWREHTVDSSNEAVHDILSRSFDKDGSKLYIRLQRLIGSDDRQSVLLVVYHGLRMPYFDETVLRILETKKDRMINELKLRIKKLKM